MVSVQGTYTELTIPSENGIMTFEFNITPLIAGGPDGYFWSQQFQTENAKRENPTGGYLGIQNAQQSMHKRNALFSIWGATNGEASPVAGAISKPFEGEGEGWQCAIPFNWLDGETYRMKIRADGKGWFTGTINDIVVGKIQLDPEKGIKLGTYYVCWMERFFGYAENKVVKASGMFGGWKGDGKDPDSIHPFLANGTYDVPGKIQYPSVKMQMG